MSNNVSAQIRVGVAMEVLWKALAVDLKSILPRMSPNLVTNIERLEGDGGLGTILFFNFGGDIQDMKYQKEKIVEYNEIEKRIGFQVLEGGRLNNGFSTYITFFQLTKWNEKETNVDITVVYDKDERNKDLACEIPIRSTVVFIQLLEKYLNVELD